MKWLIRVVVKTVVRVVRRFMAQRPVNVYEDIIFSAVRNMAAQLGQERQIRA